MDIGIYPGLFRSEYEQIDAINVSTLQHLERSPLHAYENIIHPKAPTEAMELGTAAHCAILEPRRFETAYAVTMKVDRRTTVGKNAWAAFEEANKGKELLDSEEHDAIKRMRDSVWSDPDAKGLLSGPGHNEVGIVWKNEETGLLCKALIDRISTYDGWTWIVDLKTTDDAAPRGFSRSIKKFNYGARAAFYLDGCNAVAPRDRRFAWVAVENKAPFAPAMYEAEATAIAAGRSKYMRWLRTYKECRETNQWPGYPKGIHPLTEEDTEW